MSELKRFEPAEALEEAEYTELGRFLQQLHLGLGGEEYLSSPQGRETSDLYQEALVGAVSYLGSFVAYRKKRGSTTTRPLLMSEVAQELIDPAFSDYGEPPRPISERRKRANFALKLDPLCSDAWLILGTCSEEEKRYPQARELYQEAVEAATKKLEPIGLSLVVVESEKDRKKDNEEETDQPHWWYNLEGRAYLRARAALAHLLRREGHLEEALFHYWEMLRLNPGDNQGIRYNYITTLVEQGDDQLLRQGLESWLNNWEANPVDSLKPEQETEIFWLYSYALWLYRTGRLEEANHYLKKAFKGNRHIPRLLLNQAAFKRLGRPGSYSLGSLEQAVIYVELGYSGWLKTEGGLEWLREQALNAKLKL